MADDIRSIAIITSSAASFVNFRVPLAKALVRAGLTVHGLAPDFSDEQRMILRDAGVRALDIPMDRAGMRPLRDFVDFLRLRAVLKRLKPDAVLGYFIKPIIYGTLAARAAGVKHRFALVAGLGYVFTPGTGKPGMGRRALRSSVSRLYKVALAGCARVFFHNGDDLDQMAREGLVDPAKALVVGGTGVDLSRFEVVPPPVQPIRFLMIARLLREKGVREYAEAASILRTRHPETEFHLAGDLDVNPGSLAREEVEAWVREGRIIWHGHVDDVRPVIAAASVFVLPSYREGKPRSTQEAMAMGRAVVTTDAPGCRDTVEEGVNGFKVPVGDPAALGGAMERFISDPGLAASMGKESRRLAEEWFDVHKINALILRTIGVDLERNSRPDAPG